MLRVFLAVTLLLACAAAHAQPTIVSVAPNLVTPGQKLTIAIAGLNTNFITQSTTLSLGDGIRVITLVVNRRDLITASIEVDQNAQIGSRTVRVVTAARNEIAELPGALTVMAPGSDLRVSVTIIPVDRLRLSDFDPANRANAPLLFSATIFNNDVDRQATLQVKVTHERFGLIITGMKPLGRLSPGEIRAVSNKEIDNYVVNPDAKPYMTDAMLTGLLPAGTYTYKIMLLDEQGRVLVEDAATSVLTNPGPSITLIGPGTTVGLSPGIEPASGLPYFQWTSTLPPDFELSVYEVREGQRSPEDIQRNIPVYRIQNINATSHQYPNSAQILDPQKTYAWQVTAYMLNDLRTPEVHSDMYWFRGEQQAISSGRIARIEVYPRDITVSLGDKRKFSIQAYDEQNQPVETVVTWEILPTNPSLGTIDQNGNFTAGGQPGSIAVIARSKDMTEDYANVEIHERSTFNFEYFFPSLVGNKSARAADIGAIRARSVDIVVDDHAKLPCRVDAGEQGAEACAGSEGAVTVQADGPIEVHISPPSISLKGPPCPAPEDKERNPCAEAGFWKGEVWLTGIPKPGNMKIGHVIGNYNGYWTDCGEGQQRLVNATVVLPYHIFTARVYIVGGIRTCPDSNGNSLALILAQGYPPGGTYSWSNGGQGQVFVSRYHPGISVGCTYTYSGEKCMCGAVRVQDSHYFDTLNVPLNCPDSTVDSLEVEGVKFPVKGLRESGSLLDAPEINPKGTELTARYGELPGTILREEPLHGDVARTDLAVMKKPELPTRPRSGDGSSTLTITEKSRR